MRVSSGVILGIALLGPISAEETPSVELLELLGQWQELSELGVDVDALIDKQRTPERPDNTRDTEATET
ncbi:MAG: hypothetical protein AAF460_09150 [Pseudomonadota bacterium]